MSTNKYSIFDIANWLLSKEAMTPKKLQKMLYYEYSWFLVFFNNDPNNLEEKLFDGNFESWVHGPVNYDVYDRYRKYGFNNIDQVDENLDTKFNSDVLDSLEEVYDTYSKYNGNELERLTHNEIPWKVARDDAKPLDRSRNIIDDKVIYEYYTQLASI